jgi:hypothetical protein
MTILSTGEALIGELFGTTTEQDVIGWIADIKNGVEVVEEDLTAGLNWVAAQVPNVVALLQALEPLAQAAGFVSAPELATAQAAVAALEAFAAAQNAGGASANAAALQAGFSAFKNAQGASAMATVAMVAAPAAS